MSLIFLTLFRIISYFDFAKNTFKGGAPVYFPWEYSIKCSVSAGVRNKHLVAPNSFSSISDIITGPIFSSVPI